jgi:molybdopterin synthase catalytic subunit
MNEDSIVLSNQELDAGQLKSCLKDDASGAVVIFEGRVRSANLGHIVLGMHYEAYEPMAREAMERIVEEARSRWPLRRVVVAHRIGDLAVGDLAAWIGVASEHRGEAFEACAYLIHRIKEAVPIWKKETREGEGSRWLEGETAPKAGPPNSGS